jgi:hypothetical protein
MTYRPRILFMLMYFSKDVQNAIAINHKFKNIFKSIFAEKQMIKVTRNFLSPLQYAADICQKRSTLINPYPANVENMVSS